MSNSFKKNRLTTQAIWVYVNPSGCTSPEGGSQLLSTSLVAYIMMLHFFKVFSVSCSTLNPEGIFDCLKQVERVNINEHVH